MKILCFTICLALILQVGYCQKDTVIYIKSNNKPATKNDATRYTEIKYVKKDVCEIQSYAKYDKKWKESSLKETAYQINDSMIKLESVDSESKKHELLRKYYWDKIYYHFQDFYENGQIKQEGQSKSIIFLHLEGKIKNYSDKGNLLSIEEYSDNQMIGNQNWLENGEKYIDNIFPNVDVMPEFPGGDEAVLRFIANNIKYPEIAKESNIQGKVFVRFVVSEEGVVEGVVIVRGSNPALDKEAKRVIEKLPVWIPGILDDKKVKVVFTIPINFTLY